MADEETKLDRTPIEVKNCRWMDAEHTILDCDVVFEELKDEGPIPFTTMADTDTPWGLDIWQKATAGAYGAIAEFVPPTADEARAAMDGLTKRQLKLALLDRGISPEKITAEIEAMSDDKKRAVAAIEWEDGQRFDRLDAFVGDLGTLLGLSAADLDELWQEALNR